MRYAEMVPALPNVDGFRVDESDILPKIFKEHNIADYALDAVRKRMDPSLLAESGKPEDVVNVIVTENFRHVVGRDTYEYRAMEETSVPRHVAELLYELGVLYTGGIADSIIEKMKTRKEAKTWRMAVPR